MRIRQLMRAVYLGLIVFGTSVPVVTAAVPARINFQGKLLDTNKNPRNGSYNLTFRICDTPAASCASPIWEETQNSIAVTNGVFSVQLGAAASLTSDVFDSDTRYLEIQIGAEVGSPRERLVTSAYAFRAAVADDVASGDGDYIQSRATLQSGATFYVSSGTVNGSLTVYGSLVANLDATRLTGDVPDASLEGTYTKQVVLSSNTNVFTGSFNGNGSGLTGVTADDLVPGNTNYVQNRLTIQSGSAFHVSSATVAGSFTSTGTVQLGGTAGTNDVHVKSDLLVTGNIRVNGNDILDSGNNTRLTLGSDIKVNGNLDAASGNVGITISTSILFVNATNGDNYIAFPMTAGADIVAKQSVYIAGTNDIRPVAGASPTTIIGVAANTVTSGGTVYVITSGIVTGVTANAAITVGTRLCGANSTGAGRVATCTTDGAVIGKALTGAGAAGNTITAVIFGGN